MEIRLGPGLRALDCPIWASSELRVAKMHATQLVLRILRGGRKPDCTSRLDPKGHWDLHMSMATCAAIGDPIGVMDPTGMILSSRLQERILGRAREIYHMASNS